MGLLFIVFAVAMAIATFVESGYGSTAARSVVYNTRWFELILVLMVVNLTGQIFTKKLYSSKKLTILLFHLSFVLIIIGAAITRYFGYEGSMHIREGESQSISVSTDKYFTYSIIDSTGKEVWSADKKVLLSSYSKPSFTRKVTIDETPYEFRFINYYPNAAEGMIDVDGGKPIVSIVLSMGMMGKQTMFLTEGDVLNFSGFKFGFTDFDTVDVRLSLIKDSLYIVSKAKFSEMDMRSQQTIEHEANKPVPCDFMKVYNVGSIKVILQKFSKSAEIRPVPNVHSMKELRRNALEFELSYGNRSKSMFLWEGDDIQPVSTFENENYLAIIKYGSKEQKLPFKIKLNDFILERYPGSNSPSSYKSNVTLIDSANRVEKPFSIYMNNILKYKGYRFYQSSYDNDEMGTILSINKDLAGMMVTYTGYILLFLFLILSLLNKNSAFWTVSKSMLSKTIGKAGIFLILILTPSISLLANPQKFVADKQAANEFGKVLVQDQGGRTKPLFTLSNDILRKVSRESDYKGFSSMQVFLGFAYDFWNWQHEPLIKISNNEVKKIIGIKTDYASFADIVDFSVEGGNYKIGNYLNESYSKPANARNKFDKEIIKIDERVNILYMIYKGEFFRFFPSKDSSLKWNTPEQAIQFASSKEDSLYLTNITNLIYDELKKGSSSGNFKLAYDFIHSISDYQNKFAGYDLPAKSRVKVELFYYKANIFERLFPFYATLGLVLFIFLVVGVISVNRKIDVYVKYLKIFLFAGFVFHTIGLILRWYIAGHAPMSNGYESMIFISWATLLAGFIFSRKSPFAISATAILAALTLLVAHLSFMDPEITNLVPVLKSYWLTLHVSIITSSYGFLGLGAILGLVVMVLYSLAERKNYQRISNTIDELTLINYKTLTIGLYLLTIGTFLGAVWANESWGRYWGWDPKETWSLITMIVYSFVIHSRMIKPFRGIFAFNAMSLFAFSSVLMTYFGVNYFLSGLHSYAGGDAASVPIYVYIIVFVLASLSVWAYKKHVEYSEN